MKKIYTLIGLLVLTCSMVMAQAPFNRTANTIVVDMLAQSPFNKQSEYNKSMKELLSTKEAGVLQLVSMMKAPANGDNAKMEYALGGLTYFAANDGEESRATVSNAYIKALKTTKERETLAFIIRQLEIIGKDEAVEPLATYLTDESLAGPAARALARIGSSNAKKIFKDALATASSDNIKCDLVNALGTFANASDTQGLLTDVSSTEDAVKTLLNSDNKKLQRAAVQTLGKVGTKHSLKDLAALAKQANYTLDHSGATSAYLSLIGKLINDGDKKEAEKAVRTLLKDAEKAQAYGTREAALNTLISINKPVSLTDHDLRSRATAEQAIKQAAPIDVAKLVDEALKDPSSRYRFAALRAASESMKIESLYALVMKAYPKAKDDVKTDIAGWIEEEAKCPEKRSSLQFTAAPLIESLTSTDAKLQTASAKALVRLENEKAIDPLIAMVTGNDDKSIAIGKNALANFKGDITSVLAKNLNTKNDASKVALLELLALRKSSTHLGEVIAMTNTGSEVVKTAAYNTLKDVVVAKDINSMYSLVESADAAYATPIQGAIISALNYIPAEKRFDEISSKVAKTPENKKHLYYTALAATGDVKALDVILEGFESSNKTQKDAAFDALTSWKDISAADQLMQICNDPNASPYFDRAIDAYIKLASSNKLLGENKMIYLREAMAVAKTDVQKNEILKQVQRAGTFQGLIFAGKYLDNKAVQQSAAQAVMNIALNNKSYTGPEVEKLLNKVIEVLDNPDAGYQKEGIRKHLREVPMQDGFVSIFNGKDLTGWKGLVKNPIERAKMSATVLSKEQVKADQQMNSSWLVENGNLIFNGKGDNICTTKQYGDFEMYVDWMLDPAGPEADAGIYLRGTPQVQIWDISRTNVGAEVGSGGLYNNTTNESKPSVVADNKLGTWNTFYIKMVGDRVTVMLNGTLVVDNVILENYWDRKNPIFPIEQIELQAHGCKVSYRDIYVKELKRSEPFQLSAEEKKEGFEILFDGTNMHKWQGNTVDYILEDGLISLHPSTRFGGNLYTKEEFANFVYRFEFQLTPGANNGVGIRTPLEGDAAYVGMEVQILDHDNPIYKDITPLQVHGSVYGVLGAKRATLKPAGEWNYEEIVADGDNIKVTLNGEVILDGNLKEAMKNGAADGKDHPGAVRKAGHIAFLGHGNPIKFKNIRVKRLK